LQGADEIGRLEADGAIEEHVFHAERAGQFAADGGFPGPLRPFQQDRPAAAQQDLELAQQHRLDVDLVRQVEFDQAEEIDVHGVVGPPLDLHFHALARQYPPVGAEDGHVEDGPVDVAGDEACPAVFRALGPENGLEHVTGLQFIQIHIETRVPKHSTRKAVSTRASRSSATDRPASRGLMPAGIAGESPPATGAAAIFLPAVTGAGPFSPVPISTNVSEEIVTMPERFDFAHRILLSRRRKFRPPLFV
jgi:hypothetical protein